MKISLAEIFLPEKQLSEDQQKVITELADSIKEIGLSHPVILRKRSPGEQLYKVASGERRILALKSLGIKEVEADIREIDEVNGSVVRIHENLRRFNLPWPEQVALVEELHKIRQAEHGQAKPEGGRPFKDPEKNKGWSLRDTANELKVGVGNLSEDMLLARAVRTDPRLVEITDKKTAVRLARLAVQRAEQEDEARTPSPQHKKWIDQTYLGDSAEIIKRFGSNSIDHCITDPPWIRFFDNKLRIDERTVPVFKELYRVLRPGAFLFVFAGIDDYHYYAGRNIPDKDYLNQMRRDPGVLESIGFSIGATPVLWAKQNSISRRGVRPWEYDRDFEFVVVAVKGNAILTNAMRCSGIKTHKVVPSPSMVHPNEKPLELIKEFVNDCSYEGNTIIDPFAGSGVVGEACEKMKRHYVMIERDAKYHAQILKRMGEA